MEVIYLLIPLSLLFVAGIIYFLFWAVRSGQFDDLEGAGHRILMDNDKALPSDDNAVKEKTEDSNT